MRHILPFAFALCFLSGCAGTNRASHPMSDPDATANAFLMAARDYYAGRSEGKLGDPIISQTRVRILYRYDLIKDGHHAEQVDCSLTPAHQVRSPGGSTNGGLVPAAWRVSAWYMQEGPDPEIPAVAAAIEAAMLTRLAEPTKP
jgi:hypothetical protein